MASHKKFQKDYKKTVAQEGDDFSRYGKWHRDKIAVRMLICKIRAEQPAVNVPNTRLFIYRSKDF